MYMGNVPDSSSTKSKSLRCDGIHRHCGATLTCFHTSFPNNALMGIVDTGMTVIRHMGMTIFLYRFYGNDLCAQALSTFFRAKICACQVLGLGGLANWLDRFEDHAESHAFLACLLPSTLELITFIRNTSQSGWPLPVFFRNSLST